MLLRFLPRLLCCILRCRKKSEKTSKAQREKEFHRGRQARYEAWQRDEEARREKKAEYGDDDDGMRYDRRGRVNDSRQGGRRGYESASYDRREYDTRDYDPRGRYQYDSERYDGRRQYDPRDQHERWTKTQHDPRRDPRGYDSRYNSRAQYNDPRYERRRY
ncbi:MAG: hypothetical protein Q9227_004389 [Pyrenula ochraceoflavens]